jgi:hypothetical protein
MTSSILNYSLSLLGLIYIFIEISLYYYTGHLSQKLKKYYFYKNVRVYSKFEHISKNLEALIKAPKFMDWIDKIIEADEFRITAFEVTDMDFFGPPTPEKLAFYKGKLEATNKKGVKVASNICNNRGGCTAILIIVTAKIGKRYKKLVAMVEQDRLPSGGQRIECVAGMKDLVTGSIKGPVVKEILEELPIDDIKEDDSRIFSLGSIWPSPGWSDEKIDLWAGEFNIDEEKYNYLKVGTFGEGAHEVIKVHFYEYDKFPEVLQRIGDVKAECAFWRFKVLKGEV